ncbi:ATP-sensitive inward rectifier potassium channel 11-like isoform X2 [Amphibalanus amphitrite]|uniref:ATP-sensitive inward rectifier potassium channel 11-like isoform X2 n=1 Tax=Amphibalanus amphitrite TaxID=1232801 RepID=UPI001C92729C|nr:ATP-sensitive inward rectifier potassium channel 11-like isoform X2 [Amphibalanus amphitrite]
MPRASLLSPASPSSECSLRSVTPRPMDSDCDELTPVWPGQALLPRSAQPLSDSLPLRLTQKKASSATEQALQPVTFGGSGIRHVPFSGLSLSSGSNGATYQHTVGGYDSAGGVPIISRPRLGLKLGPRFGPRLGPQPRPDIRNSAVAIWIQRVRNRISTRKLRKRVVFKNGDLNVVQGNLSKRRRRYLADIVTTLVDIKWRWTLLVFSLSFLLSWLLFAVLWWLIGVAHGDFDEQNINNEAWIACVHNVKDFTGSFLYSLETQHTIGYGYRYISDQCTEAVILLCVQSIVGLVIQALMVSIVFAKLARPKKRAQTLLFSRSAVICQRDGRLCLMFRLGNMRTSSLIGATVRAQIIRKRVTPEGETLQFDMEELNLGPDDGRDSILFIWPLVVVHTIDERSPLYHMSAEDLLHKERFEIVVMLEGSTESTAMETQARSSYIPSEILWGHRFEPIINFRKETGEYWVDYSKFNSTYEVDTPLCSSSELDQFRKMQAESVQSSQLGTPPQVTSSGGLNNFDLLRHQAETGKEQ